MQVFSLCQQVSAASAARIASAAYQARWEVGEYHVGPAVWPREPLRPSPSIRSGAQARAWQTRAGIRYQIVQLELHCESDFSGRLQALEAKFSAVQGLDRQGRAAQPQKGNFQLTLLCRDARLY